MATVYGMLGQAAPGAATPADIYTVPSAKHATAKVLVCNRGVADTFRISVAPGGAGTANAQYIAYDQVIDANDSAASVAFTVTATDVVRVYSTLGSLSFSVTGIEEDN